ncbi:MAG: HAD hydrolase family protein [Candidatus Levyibacteriota bacterium]
MINISLDPPIIQRNGLRLAVVAFSDIDGTINDESLPEKERLNSIAPAKEGLISLEAHGIPVGLITARSFGETQVYQKALGNKGFTICEDGAVVVLHSSTITEANKNNLSKHMKLVKHNGEFAVLLSKVDTAKIKEFLTTIINQAAQQGSQQTLLSTCTSTPEVLLKDIPYETLTDAKRSRDRIGSAYVRNTSAIQREIMHSLAPSWGMRVFGEPQHMHIIGKDAHKGNALQFINDNIKLFLSQSTEVDNMLPVVFGNNVNDVPLFKQAHDMNGIAVLVKNAKGGYSVPEKEIEPYILKAQQPFGYGIAEVIPQVLKNLQLM